MSNPAMLALPAAGDELHFQSPPPPLSVNDHRDCTLALP
jgi:hypothetical protein